MEASAAITINQVSKLFGQGSDQVKALDHVSVAIEENEFFTLLGPSGCGKTTLLRLIAGFEHPSEGHIMLHDAEISHLPPYKRPVNTVFQSYALFPHMSVAQNIGFGLEMQDKPAAEVGPTVDKMLTLVQMEALRDREISQLSGGQQQRVALARALAPQPKVLLLDEPLSALDYKLRKEMQIELKRLQHETGITFIFVTHDQEEALTMSDRIAVMNQGKILQVGAPNDIYDHPADRFVADFIGDTNFLIAERIVADGRLSLKLPSGKIAAARNISEGGADTVHIAIRPEHASLIPRSTDADLSGAISNIVYSGNDTHFHIALDSGEPFIVRAQNRGSNLADWPLHSSVGIAIEPGTIQVLRD